MSHAPQDTPQVQHALYYAGLGWSVVPANRVKVLPNGERACTCVKGTSCESKGKHPAVRWEDWQAKRASDDQIHEWFSGRFRDYSVGIITGVISGIIAVDVDEAPGKVGGETLNNVQMIHGDMPHTVQARTGGGGRHIILKHPGNGVWIQTAKNVIGSGVDIRGDGGFIVAAPSMHESGRFYIWDESAHPNTTEIAECPPWLIDMITGPRPAGDGSRRADPGPNYGIVYDAWGKITDGRETYMRDVISACVASFVRSNQRLPTLDEVFSTAWPTYERNVSKRGASLEADGRGETAMRHKITSSLNRAQSGRWKLLSAISAEPVRTSNNCRYDPETGEILDENGRPEIPEPWEHRKSTESQKDKENQGDTGSHETPGTPGTPESPDLYATPLSDIDLDNIPPRRWLYGRELVRGFVSVLASPGGTGKTAYTMAVGVSVAWHKPLLTTTSIAETPTHAIVHKQGNVWFYNLEDPMDEMRRRIKATLQHHKVPVADVANRIYIDSGRDRPLIVAIRAYNGDLIASPIVDLLVAELKRRKISVLVVDPFVQSHSAEENRNEEMNLVMSLWGRVAHQADCAVWLVHHFRKGGKGGDAESIRGAGAIQGAARSMFTVSAMLPEEADKLGIDADTRWQYIRHDNAKQNMAPPAGHANWYRLASVALDNGDEDYPEGDFVQAVEAWSPPSLWDGLPWSMIEIVLKKIDQGPMEGEFYAASKQSKDRWAGHVLIKEAGLSEGQAATVLRTWKDNGVLEEGQYASPRQKGGTTGCVRVNSSKLSEMRQTFRTKNSVDE